MHSPRNIYQNTLRLIEWVCLLGVVIACMSFAFGYEPTSRTLPVTGALIFAWAAAGVLSRVPQERE